MSASNLDRPLILFTKTCCKTRLSQASRCKHLTMGARCRYHPLVPTGTAAKAVPGLQLWLRDTIYILGALGGHTHQEKCCVTPSEEDMVSMLSPVKAGTETAPVEPLSNSELKSKKS